MRGYQTLIPVKEGGTLPLRDKSFIKLYKDLKQAPPHLSSSGFRMHRGCVTEQRRHTGPESGVAGDHVPSP